MATGISWVQLPDKGGRKQVDGVSAANGSDVNDSANEQLVVILSIQRASQIHSPEPHFPVQTASLDRGTV